MALYGGIETGGTTVGCIIGTGPGHVVAEQRFATTTPDETLACIISFYREHSSDHPIAAVGIGAFGPLDLDPTSDTYGFVTTTPKPDWQRVDLLGPIEAALHVPVAIDTDVNAAALGEYLWGGHDLSGPPDPLLYLTVGTGIGLGVIVDGRPLHGLLHPEAGHMLLPHDRERDPFAGACPYHSDCWEGLASGFAMGKRWGRPAEDLPADHPAWELEAHYLGLGIANLIYCYSPKKVVVGGGVATQPGLLVRTRHETRDVISGYLQSPALERGIGDLLVPPGLGLRAGLLGALALALPSRQSDTAI